MLGDIVLATRLRVKKVAYSINHFIKVHFLCSHDYRIKTRYLGAYSITTKTCSKCGRSKMLK